MDLITVIPAETGGLVIDVRGHRLVSDHAERDGGTDRGPSPVELLAASLGSCIALMVVDYCRRQGCREGGVRVSLTYELAADPKRIASLVVDIEVPADLPAEKKAAVRRIAEKCPVHATLSLPPRIDIDVL